MAPTYSTGRVGGQSGVAVHAFNPSFQKAKCMEICHIYAIKPSPKVSLLSGLPGSHGQLGVLFQVAVFA